MPSRIERRVNEFNAQNKSTRFDYMVEEISINDYPNHIFSNTDATQSAFPKYRTFLKCNK